MGLLTKKEACEILAVSIPTLDKLCSQKKLQRVKISSRGVRISVDSVQKFLDEQNTFT